MISHPNSALLAIDKRINDITPQIERYCHIAEQAIEENKCEDPGVLYKVMEYYINELAKLQQQLDELKTTARFSIEDEPNMSQLIVAVDQKIREKRNQLKIQIESLNHVYHIKNESVTTTSIAQDSEIQTAESKKLICATTKKFNTKSYVITKDAFFKAGQAVAAGALASTAAVLAYYAYTKP